MKTLSELNPLDANDHSHVIRLLDSFTLKEHYCLVLEHISKLTAMKQDISTLPGICSFRSQIIILFHSQVICSFHSFASCHFISFHFISFTNYHSFQSFHFISFHSQVLTFLDLKFVAVQLLSALVFLENHDITHCDLKLDNVMIRADSKNGTHSVHSFIYWIQSQDKRKAYIKLAGFGNAKKPHQYPDSFDLQVIIHQCLNVFITMCWRVSVWEHLM